METVKFENGVLTLEQLLNIAAIAGAAVGRNTAQGAYPTIGNHAEANDLIVTMMDAICILVDNDPATRIAAQAAYNIHAQINYHAAQLGQKPGVDTDLLVPKGPGEVGN